MLSDNKLFFFPLALLELTKLQTLELRNNALTFLPDALPRCAPISLLRPPPPFPNLPPP